MEQTELSMQNAYKVAVEAWINAIRAEENLALAHPSVRQVDLWEEAHFNEEGLRKKALRAKNEYEDAIRQDLFHF